MAKVEVKFVETMRPVESVTLVLDAEEADLVREALLHKYNTLDGRGGGWKMINHRAALAGIMAAMRDKLPDSVLDASKRVSARF